MVEVLVSWPHSDDVACQQQRALSAQRMEHKAFHHIHDFKKLMAMRAARGLQHFVIFVGKTRSSLTAAQRIL